MSNPIPAERQALAPISAAAVPTPLDKDDGAFVYGEGLDPADFDWVPVKRKRRADGWSQDRQRLFIETLAATGSVTQAAIEVGMSTNSAYRLRNAPDGAAFANAWDVATQAASRRFIDIAMERVVSGVEEAILDREGHRIGARVRYNDRLLMFMLRALQPERFRHAHRATLAPGEQLPRTAPGVWAALDALGPPAPTDPAALMAPDDLGFELELAELNDGRLSARHRDPVEAEAAAKAITEKGDTLRRDLCPDDFKSDDEDESGGSDYPDFEWP